MAEVGRSKVGRGVAAGLGGLALLAGAGYAAGYAMAGENVPSKTTVAGIPVGGVEPAQAVQQLKDGLAGRAEAPITITADDKKATLKPASSGLVIDYQATIDQAGAGKSWQPTRIWRVLRGGGELEPVLATDDAKLASAVKATAPTFAVTGRDAALAIKDAKPVVTPSVTGRALDVTTTAQAVKTAWLAKTTVPATVTETEPELTTQEAQQVADEQLEPTLSGPVVIDTGKGKISLSVQQIAAATSVKASGGTFSAATDVGKLFAQAEKASEDLGWGAPVNARVRLSGGKPTVVPSKDGQALDEKGFTAAVGPALTKTGAARTVKVPVTAKPADLTTAEVTKLGVKEVTGEFTTYFPYAEYRNTNLSLAAASINNSFVEPGEVFSLNDTLGPKGPGSGYVDGWVISGDRMKKENAGGVSQSATTTFNAAFFAGLEDVEHHPHSMYFDRYPAGREATLYYGNLDLKFRNDTPYGVLLQAYVDKAEPGGRGSITVKVWSTKVYTVTSTDLVKSNFTTGRTIHSDDPDCHAQSASQGFTVNYARVFSQGGKVVRREPFRWTYSPTDEIICD